MQPHHVSPRGFQASRAEMNKRRTVEHTDPDGQRLCWPFSFDGLRSPQTNDQTSATGGKCRRYPPALRLARRGRPGAGCRRASSSGNRPRTVRRDRSHRPGGSLQDLHGKLALGWRTGPQIPPQGFPRVPPPDSPGIGAFRPPNPPTCIVRPKSLHVQAERPSLDSARPFFRRLKTGKRKPPGG